MQYQVIGSEDYASKNNFVNPRQIHEIIDPPRFPYYLFLIENFFPPRNVFILKFKTQSHDDQQGITCKETGGQRAQA